jgi:hypothetical protein
MSLSSTFSSFLFLSFFFYVTLTGGVTPSGVVVQQGAGGAKNVRRDKKGLKKKIERERKDG